MQKKTQIVKSTTHLSTAKFTIAKTLVSINGKEKERFDVFREPTIAVFPIDHKGNIYMVKEYRYLYDEVVLGAVAGFIDPQEKPLAAAKRELKEESGITAKKWQQLARFEMARSVIKATSYLFVAKDLTFGKSAQEEDEDIELVKYKLEDLVAKVLSGEIHTSVTVAGLLLLDKMIQNKLL